MKNFAFSNESCMPIMQPEDDNHLSFKNNKHQIQHDVMISCASEFLLAPIKPE